MRRLWILMTAVSCSAAWLRWPRPRGGCRGFEAEREVLPGRLRDRRRQERRDVVGERGQADRPGLQERGEYAPVKVRSAMTTIGSYLAKFASVNSLKDLANVGTSGTYVKYAKVIGVYTKFYVQCSLSDLTGSTTTTEG